MTKKIAITAQTCVSRPELRSLISQRLNQFELNFIEQNIVANFEQFIEVLRSADGVIVGREKFSDAEFDLLPDLQVLSKYGVGLDNIDLQEAEKSGVHLSYEPGVNALEVAEHTVGLILALCRNISQSDRRIRSGTWQKDGGISLHKKTVGIVGCGHVGSELARLLSGFGAEVVINDIVDKTHLCEQWAMRQVSFSHLLELADIISVHLPLTSTTEGIIGSDAFAQMRQGAVVVNTARGEIMDMDAAYVALSNGHLSGVACDVFDPEPFLEHPILRHERFLGTPHTAGNSEQAIRKMVDAACRGIESYFEA